MKAPVLALLLGLAFPLSAPAGGLTDLLMAPGLLTQAPAGADGAILRYAHERRLPAPRQADPSAQAAGGILPTRPVERGQAVLSLSQDDSLLALSLSDDKTPAHVVAEFPRSGPNPILLFFLENVVRSMATQTGGSPYYIRNRIRDSLVALPAGTARDGVAEVALEPFAGDPNAPRMGEFAKLRLAIRYDPARPGALVGLDADTGDAGGYHETLGLIAEK